MFVFIILFFLMLIITCLIRRYFAAVANNHHTAGVFGYSAPEQITVPVLNDPAPGCIVWFPDIL